MTYSYVRRDSINDSMFKTHHHEVATMTLKLYVYFAKEPYKRDDILQKRRYSAKETYNSDDVQNASSWGGYDE